jgi:hypothetical protein
MMCFLPGVHQRLDTILRPSTTASQRHACITLTLLWFPP